VRVLVGVVLGVFYAALKLGPTTTSTPPSTGLTVKEESNRVLFSWSGTVQPPMKQRFEEAFSKLGSQPRHIQIAFNSPGGSVDHGHQVIDAIQAAAKLHFIDTTVTAGSLCASMCVPLYLVGMQRTAHPSARFMFHEVILRLKPDAERKFRELTRGVPNAVLGTAYQSAKVQFTDKLFEEGFARKLDNRWLERMRDRIKGRDVWLSGRQLMDEKSGVVDKLL
jgi:ATP-dependent protease ClpP protease subunit